MESKSSNLFTIILLLIIAFLTLALVVLAGYVFIGGNSSSTTQTLQNGAQIVLNDSEWEKLKIFEDKAFFNLKNDDSTSSYVPVIQTDIELKYVKKIKGVKDVAQKLELYRGDICEIISNYFQNMTLEEAKKVENKEKASRELTDKINELLNTSEKQKSEFIIDVIFAEWFYT